MKTKIKTDSSIMEIFSITNKPTKIKLPLYTNKISAGFPSPAEDYIDKKLDLNEYIIKHPAATFFVRANGDSMEGAGIYQNDLLIVDRSLEAKSNDIIIANLEGELTVKRFVKNRGKFYLAAANEKYPPIEVNGEREFEVWGVVTFVMHQLKKL